jgi:hypothetical protein
MINRRAKGRFLHGNREPPFPLGRLDFIPILPTAAGAAHVLDGIKDHPHICEQEPVKKSEI